MMQEIKVAYLLGTFPQLTQTFVTREIYWVRMQNVQTEIFSLFRPKSPPRDEQVRDLMPHVHYSPSLSWAIVEALAHFLRCSPRRFIRALAKTVSYAQREPKMMLQALAIFPKSVYFARQMQKLEIEHIHAHFFTLAAFAASIASELLAISYTVHGHAVDLFSRDAQDVRRQIEDASAIVTVSRFHRAFIADLCPRIPSDKVEIVYCGLEADRFRPIHREAKDSDPIRILSVGRLVEKKGFQYLIDACKVLLDSGLSFRCQIVGDGPLKNALQGQIMHSGLQDRIALLGALAQDQVLELYQQSDIFVLACVVATDGNRDGLPVVLMEAMSCELPVITTPVTGIVDLVQHNKTGLLVRERDVIGLANAVKRLIHSKVVREELGRQARQKVLDDFQVENTTAKLAALFRKVAYGHRSNSRKVTEYENELCTPTRSGQAGISKLG